MQLFTIGLVQLRDDGSPRLDAEGKTIPTYDSKDIISFAKAWTGFYRQPSRANMEALKKHNRLDPMRIIPTVRDKFPKSNLESGFIGDKVRRLFG